MRQKISYHITQLQQETQRKRVTIPLLLPNVALPPLHSVPSSLPSSSSPPLPHPLSFFLQTHFSFRPLSPSYTVSLSMCMINSRLTNSTASACVQDHPCISMHSQPLTNCRGTTRPLPAICNNHKIDIQGSLTHRLATECGDISITSLCVFGSVGQLSFP